MNALSCSGSTLLLLIAVCACGESAERAGEVSGPSRVGSTRGGAVVLSRDERVAVVCNRSAGVVTVFQLDPEQPAEQLVRGNHQLDLGLGSEPWAAVIGADDDRAYVISRRDQTLRRISALHTLPRLDDEIVVVGSEPTSIVVTPSGSNLFVANWAEGTVSIVTTDPFKHQSKLNLNEVLADTGLLAGVPPRPGLAHPRALAMTDDGDSEDKDETLYATEFFSQPLPPSEVVPGPTEFDRNRQGLVYPISVATGSMAAPIAIKPIENTGFYDAPNMALDPAERRPTSCIPNQLYAAAVAGNQLLVTSMCASPGGPLGVGNSKTIAHPVVFAIDTRANAELSDRHRVLTREIEELAEEEAAGAVPMPLIPNDIVFAGADSDGTRWALVSALGANAIYSLGYDAQGFPSALGRPGQRYLDLEVGYGARLPLGIAALTRTSFSGALVVNDNTQNMAVVDLAAASVSLVDSANEVAHAQETLESDANDGRGHFATGLNKWSLDGRAWNSCETCHPDGLSDGLTWFFARGPRRTLSAAPTYTAGQRRVMLWAGNIDEVHDIEVIVRGVAGGAGAIAWRYLIGPPDNSVRISYDGSPVNEAQNGPKPSSTLLNNLNGALAAIVGKGSDCLKDDLVCDKSVVTEWNEIDAYIQTIRAPRALTNLVEEEVLAGAELFREARCGACHAGPAWTLSRVFYAPGAEYNGTLPYTRPTTPLTAAELGRLRTEKYSVPEQLRASNVPGASGQATFRRWDPPADRDPIVHLYGTPEGTPDDMKYDGAKTHGDDQINCVLRSVGTFPLQPPPPEAPNLKGIWVPGAPPVREVRHDMKALALGDTGFNIPSLLGLSVGAPYFHAGNARTLEELFDERFAGHYRALNPDFLRQQNRAQQINEIVAYLLAIDEDIAAPSLGPNELAFDLCANAVGRAASGRESPK